MKHVFLVQMDTPRLFELSTGRPIDAYNRYATYKIKEVGHAFGESVPHQYCYSVAGFFDYCYETGVMGGPPMPPEVAQQTINLYWDFLTKGVNSTDFIIRRAAKALEKTPIQPVSARKYLAGINDFLRTSQMKLNDMASLIRILTKSDAFANVMSLPQTQDRRRTKAEMDNIHNNTLTFGNTPRDAHASALGGIPGGKVKESQVSRSFPTEKVLDLLNSIEAPQNRCVAAMIASGGLRHSEVWGIRRSDIDIDARTIRIEDPNFHRNPAAEKASKRLPYKGRTLAAIVMFEPFKSIFFESLADYLDIRPTTDSDYLFVSSERSTYGEPLLFSREMNSLNKQLNRALRKAQINLGTASPATNAPYTSHSLRHFYGVWARNFVYLPGRRQIGLTLPEIKILMGHKDIRSTEKYAQLSEENVIAEIEAAERMKTLWGKNPHIDQIRSAVYAELAYDLSDRMAA
ncbi:site-specific integrase [Pseudomonas protegens]|uniref:tyrosine-type recombinase/integrase n=1 Tax=Pseudomonas protegens TaxID=380021 RepID=UPI001C8E21CD|nr:site-specific integrase [Pseudomonas protegens]QZI69319.1 site-specific integrase [Pseudomonas protegens]